MPPPTSLVVTACRMAALRQGARGAATAAAAAASTRRGLDFRSDTRLALAAPPVVYHRLYSAPQLAPGHRFPMVMQSQSSFAACTMVQARTS